MDTLSMIANTRFQRALDILFLTMVVYFLYVWFRGTKALCERGRTKSAT